MHWKLKASIQNLIARLPPRAAEQCYYLVQRATGSFRRPQVATFREAARAFRGHIVQQGGQIEGATILEVGTGRRLTLPVCLWLLGAKRVVTVDLHNYLRRSVVALDLQALALGKEDDELSAGLLPFRMRALQELLAGNWDLADLMKLCAIDYLAPADATRLDLGDASIDYHISYTVFEHIPAEVLREILREAARILRPNGLAVHLVDHSDHFSHSDSSLSAINFLQFDDETWVHLAGNPFMYMNRLRVDDYPGLYAAAGHEILTLESVTDDTLRAQLAAPDFRLARRFVSKDPAILVTTSSWIVSRPAPSRK